MIRSGLETLVRCCRHQITGRGALVAFWHEVSASRALRLVLLIGLGVRLVGGFAQGTQDMEWWKVWGRELAHTEMGQIYGATDGEIIELIREGGSLRGIHERTGRIVDGKNYAQNYSRRWFPMVQPPVYLYAVYAPTLAYRVFSPQIDNTRLYNFFINFVTLCASGVICLAIYASLLDRIGGRLAAWAAASFWLNPVVLLNAPLQGYLDQVAAMFVVLCLVFLVRYRVIGAWICLTLAILTKPQAVLVAPVVFLVGIWGATWRKNLAAWVCAACVTLVVCLPFVLAGRFLSVIVAIYNVAQYPNAITVEALNFWWPVNYAVGVAQELSGGGNLLTVILRPKTDLLASHQHAELAQMIGVNLAPVGPTAFLAAAALILWRLRRQIQSDRNATSVVFAAGMIVFAYFVFSKAVHTNHYFVMIPLFVWSVALNPGARPWFMAVCASFLLQDLLFYGFGRDLMVPRGWLLRLHLEWATLLLSLINVGLFVWGLRQLGVPGSDDRVRRVAAAHDTNRQQGTHVIESRVGPYRWHPWRGRSVFVLGAVEIGGHRSRLD